MASNTLQNELLGLLQLAHPGCSYEWYQDRKHELLKEVESECQKRENEMALKAMEYMTPGRVMDFRNRLNASFQGDPRTDSRLADFNESVRKNSAKIKKYMEGSN